MTLTYEDIVALPKVVLHDHLDGGLRPATIIDLAAEVGHQLPSTDPDGLAAWFVQAASAGDLNRYLETFVHTLAVTQTEAGLRRVAREAVVDLAADGVVYAELRYAPEQHLAGGLSLQEVLDAVHAGLGEGVAEATEAGRRIRVGTLPSAMRQFDRSAEIAEMTLANRDRGAVGFDLAGPEDGFPPSRHLPALRGLREANFPYTIHAGEAAGTESIWEALQLCGTLRLGHGVRIMDDIELGTDPDGELFAALGDLAQWVLDRQIPLEVCPQSNLQTGIAASVAEHPITVLRDMGFAVTLNPDNRLMSATSMSREMFALATEAGWTLEDFEQVTLTAAWNAFAPHQEMRVIIADQIEPGYAAAQSGDHNDDRSRTGEA
ncbi:adenosine deaminase [Occultella glacieicola]|uniref:adenosine deaminase n=1 Tax=Occultella glacieicola TaxID=2518684 RepID=A0ABY2EBD7_9MICO|nr:adenosine deaminase [Occultella glacieicola]TDE97544.1 adenosine deaminase [Occultella glacieicola]